MVMSVNVSVAPPLLVNVSDSVALVLIAWAPKASGVGLTVRSGAAVVPVPVNVTLCGLPVALSVMRSDALREPVAVGLNVTLIVQVAPAATLPSQLFVCAKSDVFVPANAMLLIVSAEFPVLVSVTALAALVVFTIWFPNASDVGDRLTVGAAVPVPDKLTVWGLPAALSTIVTVPVRVPATVGENVTLIVQLPPGATLAPQVLLCAKSPDAAWLVIDSGPVPVLVSVTVRALLVVPTDWFPNASDVGEI
jgi:hypothetical protein